MTTQLLSNVRYGPRLVHVLDIYIPTPRVAYPTPLFILVHGGGWYSGSKTDGFFVAAAQRLAAFGYCAASINYRLLGNINFGVFPNPNEVNPWPACMQDAQLAVCWLRTQAAHYAFDGNRFIAWGASAGAHIAQQLAARPLIPNPDNTLTTSPVCAGACAHSTPSNLAHALNPGGNPLERALVNTTVLLDYVKASPVNWVLNPVGFSQGTLDTIVPYSDAVELENAYTAVGSPFHFESYAGGHVFTGITTAAAVAIQQRCEQWVLSRL